jgi:hypothetical protein
MIRNLKEFFAGALFLLIFQLAAGQADYRKSVSQYGITWEFDKPMQTGQFITGDWWVVGPVNIISITPRPGPIPGDKTAIRINHWGDTSLKQDTTMRNGSAIVLKAGHRQSYDSRGGAFDPGGGIKLPLLLEPNLTLISSISNDTLPVDNFCKNILWEGEYQCQTVMKTVAVLTCLDAVPPSDAFRPPYAGIHKPLFRARDIRRDALPRLQPAGEVPSWEEYERYFERPWIDHLLSWSQQELVPNENQPNYGREYARLVSTASLMLCLDVPEEQKEKLTIRMIQRGIDLYGLAMVGGSWNEGGGHSSGRKWPILFASIMLNDPKLAALPETAFFQEDTQTYYGEGWFGQNVLWQMIMHHGKRDTYEEKPPDQWEKWDRTSESYRICCNAVAWTGTALAARYMKAIKLWGHDAHFDYVDRWMREDDPYKEARGKYPRPAKETQTFDPFVTAMWNAHRKNAPAQEMAGNHRKWVWEGNKGVWIPNRKIENTPDYSRQLKNATPEKEEGNLENTKMDGYRGIWFELGQKYEYGDKYSGALGTYTSMHIPLAVYSAEASKTFFVYGGTTSEDKRYLLCMIGEYDHASGKVSKPTVVCDKLGVDDPHDNPVVLIDDEGYIWVFVSGRGARRPGFKYRSREPLKIDAFDRITEEEMTYPQPWKTKDGFLHLFTKYTGIRQLYFETSTDGVKWSEDQLLAAMPEKEGERSGHYQISSMHGGKKVGTFFNRHPDGNVDKRTDLYYIQTTDFARTWTTVEGQPLEVPMVKPDVPARVINYQAQGKNVYIRDMLFDDNGHPVCLYIRSNGHEPGPPGSPYEWCITRWTGRKWITRVITTSDHNYDMGSIFISGKNWKLVAPTETGPQLWGVGGEVVLWESSNSGKTWKKIRNITSNSRYNNSYVRRPVNYAAPFCFFWADGHPHEFTKSQLYFGDLEGNVWRLPYEMTEDYENPVKID